MLNIIVWRCLWEERSHTSIPSHRVCDGCKSWDECFCELIIDLETWLRLVHGWRFERWWVVWGLYNNLEVCAIQPSTCKCGNPLPPTLAWTVGGGYFPGLHVTAEVSGVLTKFDLTLPLSEASVCVSKQHLGLPTHTKAVSTSHLNLINFNAYVKMPTFHVFSFSLFDSWFHAQPINVASYIAHTLWQDSLWISWQVYLSPRTTIVLFSFCHTQSDILIWITLRARVSHTLGKFCFWLWVTVKEFWPWHMPSRQFVHFWDGNVHVQLYSMLTLCRSWKHEHF